MEIVLGGVSIIILVEIIIKLLKALKVDKDLMPLVGVFVGALLGLAASFFGDVHWLTGIVGGFVAGATTLGLYDVRHKTFDERDPFEE